MKQPVAPPPVEQLVADAVAQGRLTTVIAESSATSVATSSYLPWDKMRFKTPPADLTHEEWWLQTRLARLSVRRPIPTLVDSSGIPFSYCLPDEVLMAVDAITCDASGTITLEEAVANPATRNRYLVNSLIEEAITSSQLEGAATTRAVAKEMLRQRREPRGHSERMIFNNFAAMLHISELKNQDLTPDLVREIHRIVTDGTLKDPADAGRLQSDDSERIAVWDEFGELLHQPPPCAELEGRLARLCDFANGATDTGYMPAVLRAITVHFMVGHDHYFADGNGRTARALFYWVMLRNGYWLAEFLSISRILKKAPSQYGRSYLLTEQDEGDLTHFFIHHLNVIQRAISELHAYLAHKADELRSVSQAIKARPGEYNHRQMALIERALTDADSHFTARSHGQSHQVSEVTARADLVDLEERGLLERFRIHRQHAWRPVPDLHQRIGA